MLETDTTTSKPIRKAIAVVRKMSADEKLLLEIQKREDALRDEASAISFAVQQERNSTIERLRKKGFIEQEILDFFED